MWAKYDWEKGLPMVPRDVCIMPKEEGGLGLIDVATQGCVLAAKWVIKCVEGASSWQILLRHRITSAQHISRIRGDFALCNVIMAPDQFMMIGSLILRSIWVAWKTVAGVVRWN